MSDDEYRQWRLDNAHDLKGLRLQRRAWWRWSVTWDHDHCGGCWAKFAEFDKPGILHEGYTTCEDHPNGAGYHWVCVTCFDIIGQEMGWVAIDN